MSLVHTYELNRVNPFSYLTELLRYPENLKQDPSEWMPRNYRDTLARLATPAAAQYDESFLAEKDHLRPCGRGFRKCLDGILNYCRTKVPLGVVEAVNGNIKALLRRGRGYKNLRYLLLKSQRIAALKTESVVFRKAA